MSFFLKLISIDAIIEFVIAWLATTVKNPSSPEAQRLRYVIARLRKACDDFLLRVPQ